MISSILQLDPDKRPKVSDLLLHPFINPTDIIPPLLMPQSTLACPPSKAFLQQIAKCDNISMSSTIRKDDTKPSDLESKASILTCSPNQKTTAPITNKDEILGNLIK